MPALHTVGQGSKQLALGNQRNDRRRVEHDRRRLFRLIQASLGQQLGQWLYLSAGLRNVDIDYFTTPATGLFTAPSDADYPILANNYPLPTFPMAALGFHAELYPAKGLTVKASLYNGVAYESLHRQFRFRPSTDGIFSIGSLSYERSEDKPYPFSYNIGYVYGKVPNDDQALVRKTGLWMLAEQTFLQTAGTRWTVLLQGASMTRHTSETYAYWGAGFTIDGLTRQNMSAGLVVNRLYTHDSGAETDLEATCLLPLTSWLSVQPALHFVRSRHRETVIGLLRLNVTLGN